MASFFFFFFLALRTRTLCRSLSLLGTVRFVFVVALSLALLTWLVWGHREKGSSLCFVAGTSFLAPSTASPFPHQILGLSSFLLHLHSISLRPRSLSNLQTLLRQCIPTKH
ncbi:hypothetical protein BD289DRAFT_83371 [Coniella lustricola]|uniref:Uncharacterized protein n=1 Tax=Coniella lustricola TaxID=2025994 RepID=A0A2T3AHC8_9PEZI|nr:hypothetical protein BD289DRAFT_83371 [Coniella lustricola]